MKFTFRFTLLAILLTLVIVTVAGLGYSSYWNARSASEDLSTQILEQTSRRIDRQLRDLLFMAAFQGNLNRRLLESGVYPADDFPRLAPYWVQVMETFPRFTRISLGLEASGEWFYVRREPRGGLAIGALLRNRHTGALELSVYRPEDYPRQPVVGPHPQEDEDPRRRDWYIRARRAGRQAWSETYVFFGTQGVPDVPGVSCATPIRRADGTLVGVLTSSFSLSEICIFLKERHIGQNGFAFVVENRDGGARQVIAHPDPAILLTDPAAGDLQKRELVPTEQLADLRVQAFLKQVPATEKLTAGDPMRRIRFTHDGVSYLGSYSALSRAGAPDWLICIVLPEADVLGSVDRHNWETFLIGLAVFILALLASLMLSRRISQRLEYLAHETVAIGQWRLAARPVAHSVVVEVDRLAVAMEDTKTGLRSFQKYVPSDLVRRLLASGQEARLGGERRTLAIYFSDIADFTSISERLSPEELVEHLGEYLGACSAQILQTGGTVDKYIGDAIMAFWGAPEPNPQHALAACTAALRSQETLAELRQHWEKQGKPLFRTRIGIHTGEVVVGNIGSAARLNYTLIGDAVNLASRLEGLNKYYGTEVLISENTYQEARTVVARPLDWVSVKGKTQAVLVYELFGLQGEARREQAELAELHARALARYRARDWVEALRLFEEALRLRPGDDPAKLMIARCHRYQVQPPEADWDGVCRMDAK
jgi:adenylate cyclase